MGVVPTCGIFSLTLGILAQKSYAFKSTIWELTKCKISLAQLLVQVGAATTHWVAVAAAWGLMPELAEL